MGTREQGPERCGRLPGVDEVDGGAAVEARVVNRQRGRRAGAVGKPLQVRRIEPGIAQKHQSERPARGQLVAHAGADPEEIDSGADRRCPGRCGPGRRSGRAARACRRAAVRPDAARRARRRAAPTPTADPAGPTARTVDRAGTRAGSPRTATPARRATPGRSYGRCTGRAGGGSPDAPDASTRRRRAPRAEGRSAGRSRGITVAPRTRRSRTGRWKACCATRSTVNDQREGPGTAGRRTCRQRARSPSNQS